MLVVPKMKCCNYAYCWPLTKCCVPLVMFDLFLGLRQDVEGGAQYEAKIAGSRQFFRYFWFLGLCNMYGMSAHGFTHA